MKHALGANAAHGLRRTNADKRRAVEIALEEFPKLSTREIANVCAVSPDTVSRLRPQLSDSDSSARIGADGKTRKLPERKAGALIRSREGLCSGSGAGSVETKSPPRRTGRAG